MRRTLLTVFLALLVPAVVHATCACTGMTLKYRDAVGGASSSVYCVDSSASFDECTAVTPNPCPSGQKGWRCPIGGAFGTDADGPWIGIGYEAEATIGTGTDLDDCIFGQGIQRDLIENGVLQPNPSSGHAAPTGIVTYTGVAARLYSSTSTAIPHLGTLDGNGRLKLASDNYSAVTTQQTIKREGGLLSWSDLPAITLESGDEAKVIAFEDRFLAFVKDKASGNVLCACKFLVKGSKPAGTNALATASFAFEAGLRCTPAAQ